MKNKLALIIVVVAIILILFTDKMQNNTMKMIKSTDRPNKFISDGDTITCGKFTTPFILEFKCKVNTHENRLFTLKSSKEYHLDLNNDNIVFDNKTFKLSFSPYLSFSWVFIRMIIDSNITVQVINKEIESRIFGAYTLDDFELVLGNGNKVAKSFYGALADVKINGKPLYSLVNVGPNQSIKRHISIASYNDLGLFYKPERFKPLRQNNNVTMTPPIFNISSSMRFQFGARLRIYKDGIFLIAKSRTTGKEIVFGNKMASSTGDQKIDFNTSIDFLDHITVNVVYTNKFTVVVINENKNTRNEFPITELDGDFDIIPSSAETAILVNLWQNDRLIWSAGKNLMDKLGLGKFNRLDLTGSFLHIKSVPLKQEKWSCVFQILPQEFSKDMSIFILTDGIDAFEIKMTPQNKLQLYFNKSLSGTITSPRSFTSAESKIMLTYDGNLSLTLYQKNFSNKTAKFFPQLFNVLAKPYSIYFGMIDSVSKSPSSTGKLSVSYFSLCDTPLTNIEGEISLRQNTDFAYDSMIYIKFPLYKDVKLFTLFLDESSIGVEIADSDMFINYLGNKFLVGKNLKGIGETFELILELADVCTLLVKNKYDEIETFNFNPKLKPSKFVTLVLPDKPTHHTMSLGRTCFI